MMVAGMVSQRLMEAIGGGGGNIALHSAVAVNSIEISKHTQKHPAIDAQLSRLKARRAACIVQPAA